MEGEIIIAIIIAIALIIGCVGAFVPVVPGVLIAYISLYLLELSDYPPDLKQYIRRSGLLIITLIADALAPIITTKQWGGSSRSQWGGILGSFGGMFLGPIGILLGPILGSFLGELLYTQKRKNALQASIGASIGFLLTIGVKFVSILRYANDRWQWILQRR
ncbi:MAG: DUF456 domain-containing protein [Candidatus Absconditabacterales bacterium]|nr:DUF456 domain-containing protein [Candidatus Absconditabacterales bacterium]